MKCLPDYGRHNKSANHALLQPFLTGKAHQMAMYAFGTTIRSRWFRRHHAFTLRAADTSARSKERIGQQQVGAPREPATKDWVAPSTVSPAATKHGISNTAVSGL